MCNLIRNSPTTNGKGSGVDKPTDAFPGPVSAGSSAEDVIRNGRLVVGNTDPDALAPHSDLTSDFDVLFEAVEQDWQEQALCAQTDPEAFFPEKGGSTREAKRICRACGVRDECLEYALEHDERFGIWGGLSERERRRLKKRLG